MKTTCPPRPSAFIVKLRAGLCVPLTALLLAGCDSPPDRAEIEGHAGSVRLAAMKAEMARDKADRPKATPADGVDYKAALDHLSATIAAATAAGVREDVLENSRKLGDAEGKKAVANVAESARQWEAKWGR